MGKQYFQFKKFKVNQDRAAMKVGTDGVLIGAWAGLDKARRILDIGTGTGLIALMAAQRNPHAEIVAIDIEEEACQQAYENFEGSPWSDRLQVIHTPLQELSHTDVQPFDFIISNPPYFIKSFKSNNHSRNLARHTDSLSFDSLVHHAALLSGTDARLALIIPFSEENNFTKIAAATPYSITRLTHVKGDSTKTVVRSMLEMTKGLPSSIERSTLSIENGRRHNYTSDYKALTKDFYLAF